MATTGISIREAAADDAAAIAAIYNEAVLNTTATFDLEPESVAARRRQLESDATRLCLVAELGSRIVGWSALSRWSSRGAYERTVELSIYVAAETRRTGIGRALAEAALEAAPTRDLHAVIVQVCAENSAGLALADRLGFAQIGTLHEVGYKFGRLLDVVVSERLVSALVTPRAPRSPRAQAARRRHPPREPQGPRRAP